MTLTPTVPIEQHPTAADRERALAVINQCLPAFAKGMHAADLPDLVHEAERLEGLPTSPVIKSMRLIVGAELAGRAVAR